jgi:hypothetical protein
MYHPPEGASPWAPALQGDLPGVKLGNVAPVTGKGKGKARADDAEKEQDANGPVQDRSDPFIAVRSIETGIIDVSDCTSMLSAVRLIQGRLQFQIDLMVQECAAKRRMIPDLASSS